MTRLLVVFVTLVALLALGCGPTDARGVLEESAAALGATELASIQYQGSGSNYALGQSPRPDAPWPRFNVLSYERLIDFETSSSREALVRTQGEDPPHGGGGQPLAGEQRQTLFVSGGTAWNLAGENPVAAFGAADERALQILLTPHGFVKAALAGEPTLSERTISFQALGKYEVRGTFDEAMLVELIETTIPNVVLGDMKIETAFSEYQDFDGVKFPTRIVQTQGGHRTLDLTVSEVEANVAADIAVPEAVEGATAPAVHVAAEKLADGVWLLGGGSHHSVLVELADHVAVVEGPQNDERSRAVMAEVAKLVPEKPIRYLVNTHHHFDHSGGLRAYAESGVTIVTHEMNQPFYERTLGSSASFQPVGHKHDLTDGNRTLEIHHMAGNSHNEAMLMAYLPKERILIEADAFTPRPGPPPSPPNPFSINLYENIERLALNVDRIAPIHGTVVPLRELQTAIGR